MSYEKVSLDEVFVVPTGLKVVARLDGQDLYGSEKLNQTFLKALKKSGRTKDSIDKLNSLVQRGMIVPCFLHKSLIRFIARKVFAPKSEKAVFAFYEPVKVKKIFILLDNNVNFLTYVSKDLIALVTVHELIHMFAGRKPAMFFNQFKSDLTNYYVNVWQTIFSLDMKKVESKGVEKIIKFLFGKLEKKSQAVSTGDLVQYYKLLDSALSEATTLSKEEFNRQLRDYVIVLKLFLTDFSAFYSVVRKFNHILNPLYGAYKQVFGIKNLNTLAVQELLYPSEIIAICSEHGFRSKVTRAIKQI